MNTEELIDAEKIEKDENTIKLEHYKSERFCWQQRAILLSVLVIFAVPYLISLIIKKEFFNLTLVPYYVIMLLAFLGALISIKQWISYSLAIKRIEKK